jgi:Zn finger protein HypA/HybF involved in hydrogenase expression
VSVDNKGNRVPPFPWCMTCGNELRALNSVGECGRCIGERLYDALRPDDIDDDCEPTGSCDECGTNLYRDDDWDGLCSQCAWLAGQG